MKLIITFSDNFYYVDFMYHKVKIGGLQVEFHKSGSATIWNFIIYEKYRGQGLGKKAFKLFMKVFKDIDMILFVAQNKLNAIHIYESAGFVTRRVQNYANIMSYKTAA